MPYFEAACPESHQVYALKSKVISYLQLNWDIGKSPYKMVKLIILHPPTITPKFDIVFSFFSIYRYVMLASCYFNSFSWYLESIYLVFFSNSVFFFFSYSFCSCFYGNICIFWLIFRVIYIFYLQILW